MGKLVLGRVAVEVEEWRPSGRVPGEPPHRQPYGSLAVEVGPVYASDRPEMVAEFVDYDGCRATVIHPDPMALWQKAHGRDEYLSLMRLHGHLIRGKPTPGENIFGHPAHAPRRR